MSTAAKAGRDCVSMGSKDSLAEEKQKPIEVQIAILIHTQGTISISPTPTLPED